jgi:pimeloyl-ACP methyl ester carboxylesterase
LTAEHLQAGAETIDVAVAGGSLRVLRWGSGDRVVVALHGITATAMSFLPVVRHIDADVSLVAPDLRGRGRSGALPGPYGMAQHATDVVAVLDHLGVGSAVVMGESMGAYAAVVVAGQHAARVERLVLVDGGIPLPFALPEGVDPAPLVEIGLMQAFDRLRRTFASRDEYFDFWREHAALKGAWTEDFEAYLDYDIAETQAPELHTSVSEDAVRGDALDAALHPDVIPDAFSSLRCPVALLRATRGMNDEPAPGLPDELVDRWRAVVPQLVDEVVDDTNHYTICLGDRGARRIAEHVCGRGAEHPA